MPRPGRRRTERAGVPGPLPSQRETNWALALGKAWLLSRPVCREESRVKLAQVSLALPPFPIPRQIRQKRGPGLAGAQGLLFVLQKQQEVFNSMAEWHIPTGSLIKNKTHNTVLQLHRLSPFLPLWIRGALLLAFVLGNSWVASRDCVGCGKVVEWAELDSHPS